MHVRAREVVRGDIEVDRETLAQHWVHQVEEPDLPNSGETCVVAMRGGCVTFVEPADEALAQVARIAARQDEIRRELELEVQLMRWLEETGAKLPREKSNVQGN